MPSAILALHYLASIARNMEAMFLAIQEEKEGGGLLINWPGVMWITPAYSPIAVKSCYFLVTKLCPALCNSMDCSTPDFPVLHYLPEFAQTNGQ